MPADEGPAVRRWHEIVERRARQMDAAYAALGRTSGDFWARRMRHGRSQLRRRAGDGDLLLETIQRHATPQSTVLDVGAGAGRYALAIAPHVARVVAVEPDAAMLPLLEGAIHEAGLQNVEIVPATWQEARVEPAGLVVCAHVLYPIADIVPFLHKLDAYASATCFIALRDVVPEPEPLGSLWERFHGQPRFLQPGYVDAFDVLHEIGIHANVAVRSAPGQTWAHDSLDEAVAAAREHLILPESAEGDVVIRRELERSLVAGDGLLTLPTPPAYVAVLWWTKEGGAPAD